MTLNLPSWAHLRAGPCPACRRLMHRVDDIEGLPIYGCEHCRGAAEEDAGCDRRMAGGEEQIS